MNLNPIGVDQRIAARAGYLLAVIVMVIVAVSTLRVPLIQYGNIDAYVYTGLIHDYKQVLERYGTTYYANRVAFTVPARLAIDLFGDVVGHVLLKVLYLSAVALSAYALGHRFYSRAVGLSSAAWAAFNPWIIKALDWDYVDGVAITYTLVATCCFLVPRQRKPLFHLCGGMVFAFACNTNTFTAVLAATLIPTWLLLQSPEGVRTCSKLATVAVLGFIGGYLLVALTQYMEFPELGFGRELRTLAFALQSFSGGQSPWFHSIEEFTKNKAFYIFMPPALLIVSGCSFFVNYYQRSISRFAISALLFLMLTYAVFLFFHYGLKSVMLTSSFYFSYLFVPTLLAVVAFIGEAFAELRRRLRVLCCSMALLCFGGAWVCFDQFRTLIVGQSLTVLIGSIVALTLLMLIFRHSMTRAISTIAACTLAITVFYNEYYLGVGGGRVPFKPSELQVGEYGALHSHSAAKLENDAYAGAVFLQHAVAETLPLREGSVGFWYGANPDGILFTSVQSTFLYAYSNVISPALPGKADDRIDAETRRKLAQYRHIVILTRGEQEAEMAVHALAADGSTTRIRATFVYPGKLLSYRATFVDVLPAPAPVGAEVARLPDTALAAQNDGSLSAEAGAVRLLTDPRQWAYSASASLAALNLPARPLVLRVNATVVKGRISVMVLDKKSNSTVIGETSSAPVDDGQMIDVPIPDGSRASDVILRNVVTGISIVTVTGLTIYDSAPARTN